VPNDMMVIRHEGCDRWHWNLQPSRLESRRLNRRVPRPSLIPLRVFPPSFCVIRSRMPRVNPNRPTCVRAASFPPVRLPSPSHSSASIAQLSQFRRLILRRLRKKAVHLGVSATPKCPLNVDKLSSTKSGKMPSPLSWLRLPEICLKSTSDGSSLKCAASSSLNPAAYS